MSYLITLLCLFSLLINQSSQITMAIHAGTIDKERSLVSNETEIKYKQGLKEALRAGYLVLKNNGTHLDAVQASLHSLENNPMFNAGRGAKVNQKFECELDASIMDGINRACGAVGGVKRIKNPIDGARLVMETTRHVLLIGDAADKYAESKGVTMVPNKYFMTSDMIKEWYDVRNSETSEKPNQHETCGAIALDVNGNLAAGTSTGGITNKMAGRVGDAPIVGAGTYANNDACAVSCTGLGENMIRRAIAFDVRARMVYLNETLEVAGDTVLSGLEPNTGGFISIDKKGNFHCPYNSPGLKRAWVSDDGKAKIIIFSEKDDYTPIEYDLNE